MLSVALMMLESGEQPTLTPEHTDATPSVLCMITGRKTRMDFLTCVQRCRTARSGSAQCVASRRKARRRICFTTLVRN